MANKADRQARSQRLRDLTAAAVKGDQLAVGRKLARAKSAGGGTALHNAAYSALGRDDSGASSVSKPSPSCLWTLANSTPGRSCRSRHAT